MGNALTTSSTFARLLKDDLREVSQKKFAELSKQGEKFYRVLNSDSATEEFYEVGGLPDIPEFNGKMSYAGYSPGYYVKIEPKEFALGTQTERKFVDDNKWGVLRNHATSLVDSLGRTREKWRARPFVNAFSAAFDFMQSEEGLSLCNDSHTTKSGVSTTSGFDNAGTSALSKTSVAATWLAMRRFRDMDGERMEMDDSFAVIDPDALGDTAEEIVGTTKGLVMA